MVHLAAVALGALCKPGLPRRLFACKTKVISSCARVAHKHVLRLLAKADAKQVEAPKAAALAANEAARLSADAAVVVVF